MLPPKKRLSQQTSPDSRGFLYKRLKKATTVAIDCTMSDAGSNQDDQVNNDNSFDEDTVLPPKDRCKKQNGGGKNMSPQQQPKKTTSVQKKRCKPSECCTGLDLDTPCVFAIKTPGTQARRRKGKTTCIWCHSVDLDDDAAWEKPCFVGNLHRSLKTFSSTTAMVFETAVARIIDEERKRRLHAGVMSNECTGADLQTPCIFSRKSPGTKARQRTGTTTCIWCDAAALNDNKAWQKPQFISSLLCSLAAFETTEESIFEAALERVEDEERRNRLRAGVTSDKCTGLDPETPCVFALQRPGRKAIRRTAKITCIWCDPLALNDDAAWEKSQFIGNLVRSLVTFYTKATAIFHTALGRVTDEQHRSQLYASLASSKLLDGGTRLRLQLEQCKIGEQWSLEVVCRCRAQKPPSRKEK